MKSIFIAGTDTGIGKTTVSAILLKQFNAKGCKTVGLKPVASGSNDDALMLQAAASIFCPLKTINPIALREPIAPHLAAAKMKINLTKKLLIEKILLSIKNDVDIHIIEGAGGWSVPLNERELYSEAIIDLNMPVILVVGLRLGCLNHAILTYQNMLQMNTRLVGWIANCMDPDMLEINSNIDTLKQWIKRPCLGIVKNNQYQEAKIDIDSIQKFLFQQSDVT